MVLTDGDGEADIQLAADRDDGVGVEATVGPHGELSFDTGVAHPSLQFHAGGERRPERCESRPARSRAISTSPVPAATASNG